MMFIYTLLTTATLAAITSEQASVMDDLKRSCRRVNQSCKGFSQDQADSQCCSDYCHVMSVNKFGKMRGICEQSCNLNGQTCSGKSQKWADAQCCSGSCKVLSVDADLNVYGECQKASCQPLGAACQGRTLGEADSQCCSDRCDYLVWKNGVYYGTCYRSNFNALDGVAAAERTIVNEQSTSAEGAPTPVANPITTPVTNPISTPAGNTITGPASCKRVEQSCKGFSQGEADSQCCSSYCHVMFVNSKSGHMRGLCEESCQLVGNTCSGKSQIKADAKCCSGSCDVLSVDKEGTHFGRCVKPSCQPLGADCQGRTFGEADSQCCSSNCNNFVRKNGVYYGTCDPENVAKKAVVQEKAEEEAVENNPGSCRKNDRPCWGFSQGEADDMCCSEYCHILEWDRDTGKMNGRCEDYCELRGASCSGKSQIKADAKCCSGSCDVEGVDEKGNLYGTCDKATPVCKPVFAKCSGKYINDADAQCCSGNCGKLVFFDGEYHGRCTLFGEDGQSDSKQPASEQNSAGEA